MTEFSLYIKCPQCQEYVRIETMSCYRKLQTAIVVRCDCDCGARLCDTFLFPAIETKKAIA